MQRINAWHNCLFLSTPSGWRATVLICVGCPETLDFYPRPPGGGRHSYLGPTVAGVGISIHALRVEGDFPRPRRSGAACISIHALRVEGDSPAASFRTCPPEFLSTPSGWRATVGLVKRSHDVKISIHALRVEGDEFLFGHGRVVLISIHALRVEGDFSR